MMNIKNSKHNDTNISYPSLIRHLLAIIYDSILLIPVLMMTGLIVLVFSAAISGDNSKENLALYTPIFIRQLVIVVTIFCFFSWFWIKNGQTLGMQAWRIKLISTSGEKINPTQVTIRLLVALISAGCFGLGYLWVLFEAKNRSWHDILSKTRLVLLSKVNEKNLTESKH